MQEVQGAVADLKENNCPRCLQPLAGKVARCPGCGQPIEGTSLALRLAIGVAGVIALVFAVVILYQSVRNEEASNAVAPIEEGQKTPEEVLFPTPAPDSGSKAAPKPEKKPPLNEK